MKRREEIRCLLPSKHFAYLKTGPDRWLRDDDGWCTYLFAIFPKHGLSFPCDLKLGKQRNYAITLWKAGNHVRDRTIVVIRYSRSFSAAPQSVVVSQPIGRDSVCGLQRKDFVIINCEKIKLHVSSSFDTLLGTNKHTWVND